MTSAIKEVKKKFNLTNDAYQQVLTYYRHCVEHFIFKLYFYRRRKQFRLFNLFKVTKVRLYPGPKPRQLQSLCFNNYATLPHGVEKGGNWELFGDGGDNHKINS